MIKPTVGRKVWYRPQGPADDIMVRGAAHPEDGPLGAPLDATIVCVHSDTRVNLVVFDANGIMHQRCSIELVQPNCERMTTGSFCEWMPYQKGQAAKTEEIEKQVEG